MYPYYYFPGSGAVVGSGYIPVVNGGMAGVLYIPYSLTAVYQPTACLNRMLLLASRGFCGIGTPQSGECRVSRRSSTRASARAHKERCKP